MSAAAFEFDVAAPKPPPPPPKVPSRPKFSATSRLPDERGAGAGGGGVSSPPQQQSLPTETKAAAAAAAAIEPAASAAALHPLQENAAADVKSASTLAPEPALKNALELTPVPPVPAEPVSAAQDGASEAEPTAESSAASPPPPPPPGHAGPPGQVGGTTVGYGSGGGPAGAAIGEAPSEAVSSVAVDEARAAAAETDGTGSSGMAEGAGDGGVGGAAAVAGPGAARGPGGSGEVHRPAEEEEECPAGLKGIERMRCALPLSPSSLSLGIVSRHCLSSSSHLILSVRSLIFPKTTQQPSRSRHCLWSLSVVIVLPPSSFVRVARHSNVRVRLSKGAVVQLETQINGVSTLDTQI